MRGVITPAIQYPAEPLKSDTSKTPIPIPAELSIELAGAVQRWVAFPPGSDSMICATISPAC